MNTINPAAAAARENARAANGQFGNQQHSAPDTHHDADWEDPATENIADRQAFEERESEIRTQLAATSVEASYRDGRAIVLHVGTDGDYYLNVGYNEFDDDNASVDTINWGGSRWQGSEADGMAAFRALTEPRHD